MLLAAMWQCLVQGVRIFLRFNGYSSIRDDMSRHKQKGARVHQGVRDSTEMSNMMREIGLDYRRFVLLQGPSSRFFAHLARALRSHGADVKKIGFCPGDRLFWARSAGSYLPYRGQTSGFGDWLREVMISERTTDVIMLGDGRALHACAVEMLAARSLDVRIWIVEHGYLRPDLILIEPDGMGGASTIPDRNFTAAEITPHLMAPSWKGSFFRYAIMDVAYHASNILFSRLRYPHYSCHSGIHPLSEYSGWAKKFLTWPKRRRLRRQAVDAIAAHGGPLFLFPLQLSQDTQLVKHGTGESQIKILERVVNSFLANAVPDARLVVKVHPLDNGLTDWQAHLAFASPRVVYLDGGDLDHLVSRVSGVVTVNSTVGLTALQAGVPTHAVGNSVYRRAGLTDQQPLNVFWQRPQRPDLERVQAFCRFLRSGFHVPGSFDGPGALVGAGALAQWLANPPPQAVSDAA